MTKPDVERLRALLSDASRERMERIDTFASIGSTNSWLKDQPPPRPGNVAAAMADHQTAGRGRHDRAWLSAPGCSLCLSLAYTFREPPDLLPPLTLAVGVATANALASFGIDQVRLKWPNDLLVDGAKLGGILVESSVRRGNDRSSITITAGIGINLTVPDGIAGEVDSAWAQGPVGLDTCGAEPPGRDELAARLVDNFIDAMSLYDEHGLVPFEQEFVRIDWLLGRPIVVETPDGQIEGVAAGIERDGSLLLQRRDRVQRVFSGSIRIADRGRDERRAL